MNKYFNKKVFSFKVFFGDICFLITKMFEFRKLKKNEDINDSFQEKIMTVASVVNGCVYCKWFHAKQSVKVGISSEEVKKMMELQFNTVATDFELNALVFAQHYAETNRKPEKEILDSFISFYGDKTANHIILILRMIFVGNLYGNTLDAFVSRLKGKPAEKSSLLFEFWFFSWNWPIYLILRGKV